MGSPSGWDLVGSQVIVLVHACSGLWADSLWWSLVPSVNFFLIFYSICCFIGSSSTHDFAFIAVAPIEALIVAFFL